MYEYRVPLSEAQLNAYLKRLDIAREPLSLDYLNRIIKTHLRTIPFDDADVWATGRCPSLVVADLFEKIIERQRGGFCFELNLLFWNLLRSLGFDCYPVIVHLKRPEIELAPPAHCAVVIVIGGMKYFADVGYGGPVPDGAVPFTGEIVNGHVHGTKGVYTVISSLDEDGSPFPRFTFKDVPCDPVEVIPLNFHTSERPGSVFAAALKMNLRTDTGYVLIEGRTFKYKNGEERIERLIEDEADARRLAEKYFGIPGGAIPTRPFD